VAEGASHSDFVLVVDDEPMVAEMAAEALMQAGYRALFALDAYAGMGQLERNSEIDLLFTDVVMPGIDGFRLADMATARRPWLRVLYTTGYLGLARELQAAGELHGAILDKPYRPDSLVAAVKRALS
jgi:DNA-binding NtrC family response regulator